MAKQVPLLTYAEVRGRIGTERSHLLLGNGFSIACDTIFGYENLLKFAKANGLTKRILGVFEHLGTNDFERVMRLLDDADWITQHYRLRKPSEGSAGPFAADLAIVKTALIEAITRTHLAHPNLIPESRKKCCAKFLKPYHNVFTTNYDALLYWVEMSDPELLGQDGFRADEDEPDAPHVIFREHVRDNKGIFFVHGALHLFMKGGQIRKHCWNRTGKRIIENVQESLEQGEYPLFVAEGEPLKKLEQIRRNGYLSYCYDKLGRVEKNLVVFGLSFAHGDQHIADLIAKAKIHSLYVGLFGKPTSVANRDTIAQVATLKAHADAIRSRGRSSEPLNVQYYDSATAAVWDPL